MKTKPRMFENIVVITKDGLQLSREVSRKINELFHDRHLEFVEYREVKERTVRDSDLAITVGGDGTFAKAANLVNGSYLLGINSNPSESEGALTSLDICDIERLEDLINNNFEVMEHTRAQMILNGKHIDELATNEIYIGTSAQFLTSRYKIRHKGVEEEQRSSGVIVTTGTGSSGWFNSAGGKKFGRAEKKLAFLVREPYIGERLFRPELLKGEIKEKESIILTSTRDYGGIIAINSSVYNFNGGDIAEIKISDKPTKVIKFA